MSVKEKSAKNGFKANPLAVAVVTLLFAVLMLGGILYALFSASQEAPFDENTKTGIIQVEFDNLRLASPYIFDDKGKSYDIDLPIRNSGEHPFFYEMVFSIEFPERGAESAVFGLENATLVYFDGVFIGVLSSLTAENGKFGISVETPLNVGETFTHALTLEYHLGANDYYSDNAEAAFSLSVEVNARQLLGADKYLFVSDFHELTQAVKHYIGSGYTVQLTDNITFPAELSESFTADRALNLNLAGKTLDLNGHTFFFSYDENETSEIYSSRTGGSVIRGGFEISTPSAYVLDETGADLEVFSASESLILSDYADYFRRVTDGGVTEDADLYGYFKDYLTYSDASFISDNAAVISNSLNITRPYYSEQVKITLKISGADYETFTVKVWGRDEEAVINNIIENNFKFLTAADGVSEITGNIFLPAFDKTTNAKIIWISENRTLLDEKGNVTRPYEDADVELSAIISVNGKNYLRTFDLTIKSKTPEEKLKELISIYGSILFTQLSDLFDLPRIEDFDYMGIGSLEYTLPEQVMNLFRIDTDENKISLIRTTDIKTTYLEVSGEFNNGSASGRIEILIDLQTNISYWDAAYNYLVTTVEIDEKELDGFDLPPDYKETVTMEYRVYNGEVLDANDLPSGYINPLNTTDYVKVKDDNTGVYLVYDKLPSENTIITVAVNITHDGDTRTYYLRFTICGVIHIEDVNLLQELRKTYINTYGLSKDDVNFIFTKDMADRFPTSFSAGSHNIVSLSGLEYFTNLTYLDLSYNYISDLSPLKGLTALETLYLHNNQITATDDLQYLNRLRYLNLASNQISEVKALSGLVSLIDINLAYNPSLDDINSFGSLTAIRSLQISGTAVDSELYFPANANTAITLYQKNGTLTHRNSGTYYPTATELAANTIINKVVPIYEFYNVIYLPGAVDGYTISWTASHDDIIKFNGNRAYIDIPIADVDVNLRASITYGGYTIYKYFDALSRGNHSEWLIEVSSGVYTDARTAIPDESLRYYLLEHFGKNASNITTLSMISSNPRQLNLSGKNISDVTGIDLFAAGLIELHLVGNNIESFEPLGGLYALRILSINGTNNGIGALESLRNLTRLEVYGLKNVNSDESLAVLYNVYLNNPNIWIFIDSLSSAWNPYNEPLTKAIKNVDGIIMLYPGTSAGLQGAVEMTMYNGDKISVGVSYTRPSPPAANPLSAYPYDLSGNAVYYSWNRMLSEDTYSPLEASVWYNGTQIRRTLQVVCVYESGLLIQIDKDYRTEDDAKIPPVYRDANYKYKPLITAVPNNIAREAFISTIPGGVPSYVTVDGVSTPYIPKSAYITLQKIDFAGMGMHGVRGLELLKDSTTLREIVVETYTPRSGETGSAAWREFEDAHYLGLGELFGEGVQETGFSALISLGVRCAVFDLYEIVGIAPQITKLRVWDSIKAVLEREVTEGASTVRESVFEYFSSLVSLTLTDCEIRDFWPITALAEFGKLTELNIYQAPNKNDSSVSYSPLTDYYVTQIYKGLTFGTPVRYYVLNNSTLWQPPALEADEVAVVFINAAKAGNNAHEGITYVNYVTTADEIRIPIKYRSAVANMRWTFEIGAGALLSTASADSAYETYTFRFTSNPQTSAYIVMRGELFDAASPDTVYFTFNYVFVLHTPNKNASYLDLNDFMTNGKFEDVNFIHAIVTRVLTAAGQDGSSGLFLMSTVADIYAVNLAYTDHYNGGIFGSIKGIKNFTNVNTVRLWGHSICDISELYYLTGLQTLEIQSNRINSLKMPAGYSDSYGSIPAGRSIFYRMYRLGLIQLSDNHPINDYSPITEREATIRTAALQALNTISLYVGDGYSFQYDDPMKIYQMATEWWAVRKDAPSNECFLRIRHNWDTFSYKSGIEGYFSAVETLKAFDAEYGGMDIVPGSTILPTTWGATNVYWDSYSNIFSMNGNTVQSVNDGYHQLANHDITVRIYTGNWITMPITVRLVSTVSTSNPNDWWVELLESERAIYQPLRDIPASAIVSAGRTDYLRISLGTVWENVYSVKATSLIPDLYLRMAMFNSYDQNRDGILSISERGLESGGSGNWGTYGDIRGMELLYNIYHFQIHSPTELYQLPIRNVGRMGILNIYSVTTLRNVSAFLGYDADGAGNNYIALKDVIGEFTITGAQVKLPDSEFKWIAENMTALGYLSLQECYVADYDVLHPLVNRTGLYFLGISNNTIRNLNNNEDKYNRIILDSYTTRRFQINWNDPLLDIINQYVKPEILLTGENALPVSFKIPGYDREYKLEWYAPTSYPAARQHKLNNLPNNEVFGYDVVTSGWYTLTKDGATGEYKINVPAGAPSVIPLIVSVSFSDDGGQTWESYYHEKMDFATLNSDYDPDKLYYTLSGDIWSEEAGLMVSSEDYIPDAVLRYYFFKLCDIDGDGRIDRWELDSRRNLSFADERQLSSLIGLKFLFATTTIQLNYVYTYDLQPIAEMQQLENLSLLMAYLLMPDMSFVEQLPRLQGLNLNLSTALEYSFLLNNSSIYSLSNISGAAWYGSAVAYQTLYAINSWAFARLYFYFNDNYASNQQLPVSTQDEKWAAIWLSGLDWDDDTPDEPGILMKDNANTPSGRDFSEVVAVKDGDEAKVYLPSFFTYENIIAFSTDYIDDAAHAAYNEQYKLAGKLSYVSLSRNVEICQDADGNYYALVKNDPLSPVQRFSFVARITYNGGSYERIFTVRYPE